LKRGLARGKFEDVLMRKNPTPSQQRAKTDKSLRKERRNIDETISEDRASAERDADGVVHHARNVADAVLSAARLKADDESLRPQRPGETRAALAGERARADRAVRGERAAADRTLRDDRLAQADALSALLVLERAATDTFLLTERARSADAIAHRDDFLGMVAHDVRNLLNGIVLSVELLRTEEGADEKRPQTAAAVKRIRSYAARMNRLIGDLVDVTSIDAGKLAVTLVRDDAAAVVGEAAETFQPAAVEKGIALEAEIPPGPLHASFDHDRMLQVFANLIANAIKFTAAGGKIGVRVERAEGELRFCVSDTGVGVPEGMRDAIFERFWQVDDNDRRGQGLGLYISKSIVEAHHGRIWAESTVGEGSRFYFTLPVASTSQAPRRARLDPRRGRSTARTRGR
jgi:signal transduction histidine kinase